MFLSWFFLAFGLAAFSICGASKSSVSGAGYIKLSVRAAEVRYSMEKRLHPGKPPVRLDHNEQAYLIDSELRRDLIRIQHLKIHVQLPLVATIKRFHSSSTLAPLSPGLILTAPTSTQS